MKRFTVRGAITAAAMVFVSLFGAEPTGAWAQETAPAVIVAAATSPLSGRDWIAQGTVGSDTTPPVPSASPTFVPTPQIADSLQQLVGDMPVEIELTADVKCLAQAIYFEARGEPLDGQLAVAEVIINRATSGKYPSSYCAVVTQPAQFSFVRRGRIPQADESSSSWCRARAVALIAEQNLWESQAADALYFHASYVKPGWARQKKQLARIDTHIFYR
jgi:spore germination cell wall hydrolase CwlJ-like protein